MNLAPHRPGEPQAVHTARATPEPPPSPAGTPHRRAEAKAVPPTPHPRSPHMATPTTSADRDEYQDRLATELAADTGTW